MADDFCLIHGYEHMKSQWGNPIPYCEACEESRKPTGHNLIDQVEKQGATCHCGKDGHALNSVNCPVHGWHEKTAADAPCHYRPQEAEAWASGYNAALSRS